MSEEKVVAVIMVGGPTKGNIFFMDLEIYYQNVILILVFANVVRFRNSISSIIV